MSNFGVHSGCCGSMADNFAIQATSSPSQQPVISSRVRLGQYCRKTRTASFDRSMALCMCIFRRSGHACTRRIIQSFVTRIWSCELIL